MGFLGLKQTGARLVQKHSRRRYRMTCVINVQKAFKHIYEQCQEKVLFQSHLFYIKKKKTA